MKKILYITGVFLQLSLHAVYAQEKDLQTASLSNSNFAADSSARYLYDFAQKRPHLFANIIPDNFNIITLGHQFDKGDYIPVQYSSKTNTTYLNTEGKIRLKDVDLFGSFNYQKTSEDSTRWAQQSRNNPSAPYYYGSPAAINYERSVYNFKGTAERNMIKNNLPLSLGINYRIGDHYATNDPRGAVSDYQLNLFAGVGYYIFPRLRTGIALKYGYGQERIRVDYKNKKYFETSVYPDYINYVVNGYGEPTPKNSDRKFDNDQTRKGIEGYVLFNTKNIGNFIFSMGYQKEDQLFSFKSTDSDLIQSHNDYELTDAHFDLIWHKDMDRKKILIALNYQNIDGADYNYALGSNNYLYNKNELKFKTILLLKNKTNSNFELELSKSGEERQDGVSGNLIAYNSLRFQLGTGVRKQWKNQSLGLNIAGFYKLNLDDQFVVPLSNEKIFTKDVIYHDYLYNTSGYYGAALQTEYNFPGYKNIQTGIKIGLNYASKIDMKTLERNLSSLPGNSRYSGNIALNLYF